MLLSCLDLDSRCGGEARGESLAGRPAAL